MSYSRICPFCNTTSTITDSDIVKYDNFSYLDKSDDKYYLWKIYAVTCPSEKCGKVQVYIEKYLNIRLSEEEKTSNRTALRFTNYKNEILKRYTIEPEANVKIFPDYIPEQILQDYKEAKLIVNISPKASATISRRCLQTMIRDFWAIKGAKSLHHEIEAIKDKIDSNMYGAIMALKSIGNIGAHPEKDINIIVDVEPEEAEELVWLIETLIEDWYIVRHDRENRISKIKSINSQKQLDRKIDPYSTN